MDNYDAIAENYNTSEQDAITLWRLGYSMVSKQLGNLNGRAVLDYGCGTGTFSRFLESEGAMVTGVDVSDNMIEVAKQQRSRSITYYPIINLDFLENETFDFVVTNFVLCTISSRWEILSILQQIHRVLKKGGRFLILNSNWDRSNGKEFLSFKLEYSKNLSSGHPITAIITSNPPIPLHDYFWSIEDYQDMLKESGFTNLVFQEEIAKDDDVDWLDEIAFPPYYLISARK